MALSLQTAVLRTISFLVPVSHVTLFHAMPCYTLLCYAMLYYAMLCHAIPCYAMLCPARIRKWALGFALLVLGSLFMLYYAMLCHAMPCYTQLGYASGPLALLLAESSGDGFTWQDMPRMARSYLPIMLIKVMVMTNNDILHILMR